MSDGITHVGRLASTGTLRLALPLAALGLFLTGAPVSEPILEPAGMDVFAADLLVVLALAGWATARVSGRPAPILETPLLGWPLAILALGFVPGMLRAHERYDSSLLGQSARIFLFAGIAAALAGLRPADLYAGVVALFYAGAVVQSSIGTYHLVLGTSQARGPELSTGGIRYLSLEAAMYLAAALILALLNLGREQSGRHLTLHAAVAAVACYGIVLSFSRTTFLGLAVVVPALLVTLPALRARIRRQWRTLAAAVVAAAAIATIVAPALGTSLVARVTANPLEDKSVRWRVAVVGQTLAPMRTDYSPREELLWNRLADGSFESGETSWAIQGGRLVTVAAHAREGERSLRIVTNGGRGDEGAYSHLVPARRGQTWTFSAWLAGATGGEVVSIAIWEYDGDMRGMKQHNRRVAVDREGGTHSVSAVLQGAETKAVRALIRTRRPQALTVYADSAELVRRDAADGVGRPPREDGLLPVRAGEALFGLGFGRPTWIEFDGRRYYTESAPDNSFLYVLAGGGVVALAGLLLVLWAFFADARRRLRELEGTERVLVLFSVATVFVLLLNCLTGPFLLRPGILLTLWMLMLIPALVTPAGSRLFARRLQADDASGPRRLDGGEHDGEAADVVPSARFGLAAFADRGRELGERAGTLLGRKRRQRNGPGEATSPKAPS